MARGRQPLTDAQVEEILRCKRIKQEAIVEKRRKGFIYETKDIDLTNIKSLYDEIESLNNIKITWRDYCLLLINSTPNPLRSIWREKVSSSLIHTIFTKSAISESNLVGLGVMLNLPNDFTNSLVDDCYEFNNRLLGRLPGSKKMDVILDHYPQESLCNEAYVCLSYILKNFDKYGNMITKNEFLSKCWSFSQKYRGNVLFPDETLNFFLEFDSSIISDSFSPYSDFMNISEFIFKNGIDNNKFKKFYVECDYPINPSSESTIENLTLEEKIDNFQSFIDKFLKEDIKGISNWKRIAIAILKNDVTLQYAGMARTWKERQAQEDAFNVFRLRNPYTIEGSSNTMKETINGILAPNFARNYHFDDLNKVNVYLNTSYFYMLRFLNQPDAIKSITGDDLDIYLPISICIWDPKWYINSNKHPLFNYKGFVPKKYSPESDCENCAKLHKDDPMYDGDLKCDYLNNYRYQLSKYNFERTIIDIWDKIYYYYRKEGIELDRIESKGNLNFHLTFLGYEVPEKKCSERFVLKEWINNNGVECEELRKQS